MYIKFELMDIVSSKIGSLICLVVIKSSSNHAYGKHIVEVFSSVIYKSLLLRLKCISGHIHVHILHMYIEGRGEGKLAGIPWMGGGGGVGGHTPWIRQSKQSLPSGI